MMNRPTNVPCQLESTPAIKQAVADHLDQGRTDHRTIGAALASHQARAADHGSRDHAQLPTDPHVVERRTLPAGQHHRGDCCRQARDDVSLQLDSIDRHAGQARRILVAADREQVAAPAGQMEDEAEHQGQEHQHPDRVGDPERLAAADLVEQIAVGTELVDHLVLRQDDRDRAGDRQHAEGDHERRQLEIGDQGTIDRAGDDAGAQTDQDRQERRIAGLQDQPGRDPDHAHDRADREVDAAGQDHRRHAQGHDPDEGEVAGDVVEVVERREGLRLDPAHAEADHEQRDRDPERLAGEHPLAEAALLDAGDVVDLDAGTDALCLTHSGTFRRYGSRR